MNNPFEILKSIPIPDDEEKRFSRPEKISQKPLDVAVRKITESNPELKQKIIEVMRNLSLSSEALPLIHITTDRIILPDDIARDSKMIEQIENQGFKGRHTNVGAFVTRRGRAQLAEPTDYENNPEDFLKSFIILLRRYLHHGLRTNKDVYAEKRNQGKGIPIMLVIRGGLPIERGTDYDDHYILKEDVPAKVILGKIEFEAEDGINDAMVARTANDLLEVIDTHTKKYKE